MKNLARVVMLKNLARAEVGRDVVSNREIIEPHHQMMKEINEHNARDLSIRQRAYYAMATLLFNPYTVFNFTNVALT